MSSSRFSSVSHRQAGSTTTAIIAVVVLVLGMVGWVLYHITTVNSLEAELAATREELTSLEASQQAALGNVAGVLSGQAGVLGTIAAIDDPLVRFAMFSAYAEGLKAELSENLQDELEIIVVFVEANKEVLIQVDPALPSDVADAVEAIKAELEDADLEPVAAQQVADTSGVAVGDEVTGEGVLTFVKDDPITGAGIFTIETDAGDTYLFLFSATNSAAYQESLDGERVSITVEITSVEAGSVTYDVITGPTLVAEEPEDEEADPTAAPEAEPTEAETEE